MVPLHEPTSALEMDWFFTHVHLLLVLLSSGVSKAGKLHPAICFSYVDVATILHAYTQPLLLKMHYVEPLLIHQVEHLCFLAIETMAVRLERAEVPLGREVVEYMLDHGLHL